MSTLTVEKRDATSPGPGALRRAGSIPAVVYGPHQASTPITLNARAFDKVLRDGGESTVISLVGLGEDMPALIHEVDLDPVTHLPRHVDFYAVTRGEKVEVAIPLAYFGESPAVEAGANLVKVLYELPIKADPMRLPHEIAVDLSVLAAIGDQIRAEDLTLPTGVELALGPEEVVALVQEVVEEKIEEVAPADLSAIEVEQKGKEEAEGEAAEESK